MNGLRLAFLMVCLNFSASAQPAREQTGRYMLAKCEALQNHLQQARDGTSIPPDPDARMCLGYMGVSEICT
jgi:hypothetical protein